MTDDRPTIVVCDDDRDRVKRWSQRIEQIEEAHERFRVVPLEPEHFAAAYKALKDRQLQFRAGERVATEDEATVLDRARLVVIDYDLTPTRGAGDLDKTTLNTLSGSFGDNFAYLTRCFSSASYTVLVNQDFFQSTFDLSHQKFVSSNADLNVAHDDLGRAELWTGRSSGTTFRPWSWPRLVDAPQRAVDLASGIDLDAPVLEELGLADDDTYDQFAPEQLVLFGQEPREVRFLDAVDFTRKFNRLGKPETLPDEHLTKIAAASVSHWLERIVLPAQNVLVDAPHLAQRRPGLLLSAEPDDLKRLSDLSQPNEAAALFDSEALRDASAHRLSAWMSRPVWLWHRCPRSRARGTGINLTFCEDVSAFHPIDDTWEYTSSVPGSFNQRFVLHDGVDTRGTLAPDYWPVKYLFEHAETQ